MTCLETKKCKMSLGKPYIEKAPSILFKPDGSLLMECMVNAKPEPDVKWFFKGKSGCFDLQGKSLHGRSVTDLKAWLGR